MKKNLCTICVNKKYIISEIEETNFQLKRRLLELGFFCGENVKVVRKSLSGNTILVEIGSYLISLRCSVASMVVVK